MPSSAAPAAPRRSPAEFATTHWSVVLHAQRRDAPEAQAALAHLCQGYWFPLYAHVRRLGYGVHDAQDLTQAFFARMLERELFSRADPARGRFRSFVLTALKHFLADAREKARARKRDPGAATLSIDLDDAEHRLRDLPVDSAAPDKLFDREWALTVLHQVMAQLAADYRQAGKEKMFETLKPALLGARDTQPYAALGGQVGLSEGAVKVAVHRLRRRYRELLEAEIAQTVATPAEAAAEREYLLRALADA